MNKSFQGSKGQYGHYNYNNSYGQSQVSRFGRFLGPVFMSKVIPPSSIWAGKWDKITACLHANLIPPSSMLLPASHLPAVLQTWEWECNGLHASKSISWYASLDLYTFKQFDKWRIFSFFQRKDFTLVDLNPSFVAILF